MVCSRHVSGDWPGAEDWTGLSNDQRFPAIRLAVAAAIIFVANAHLSRTFIAFGRWMLVLGACGAVLPGRRRPSAAPSPPSSSAWRRAQRCASRLGTSAGLPSIEDIADALANLGVGAHDLAADERQSAGIFRAHATDASGGALAIKVYGRDAYDNQMLAKFWRTLWYRDGGGAHGLNRAQGPEREALLTLLAAPRRRADRRGRDGRRHARRRLAARAARVGADARGARCRGRSTMRSWARSGRQSTRSAGPTSPTARSTRPRCASATAQSRFVDLGNGIVAPSPDERLSDRAQLLGHDRRGGRHRARGRRGGRRARPGGTSRSCCRTSSKPPSAWGCAVPSRPPESTSTTCARRPRRRPRPRSPSWRSSGASPGARSCRWGCWCLAAYAVLSFFSGVDFGDLRGRSARCVVALAHRRGDRRPAAARDPGRLDARRDSGAAAVRPGLRDAARDELHEPRAALELRPHGRERPLLPAAGRATGGRDHLGHDRLVHEHRGAGRPARAAAALLRAPA